MSNSVVITNNSSIGHGVIYCESHGQIFKVHVKLVSNDEISKRLTIVFYLKFYAKNLSN